MGKRGNVAVVVAACAAMLTGCAQASAPPASSLALPGARVEGSVQLVEDGKRDCWAVRFEQGGRTVQAPLRVPDGYMAADIVMADPMNPGHDYPGPALMDRSGQPIAFAATGVIIAASFAALDDPKWAVDKARCGWTTAPLIADEDNGVTLDPDGLDTVVIFCHNGQDPASGLEGDTPPPINQGECARITQEPWNNG
jgi:hypothetical protein